MKVSEKIEGSLGGILKGVLPTSTWERVDKDIIEAHIKAGIKNIKDLVCDNCPAPSPSACFDCNFYEGN